MLNAKLQRYENPSEFIHSYPDPEKLSSSSLTVCTTVCCSYIETLENFLAKLLSCLYFRWKLDKILQTLKLWSLLEDEHIKCEEYFSALSITFSIGDQKLLVSSSSRSRQPLDFPENFSDFCCHRITANGQKSQNRSQLLRRFIKFEWRQWNQTFIVFRKSFPNGLVQEAILRSCFKIFLLRNSPLGFYNCFAS